MVGETFGRDRLSQVRMLLILWFSKLNVYTAEISVWKYPNVFLWIITTWIINHLCLTSWVSLAAVFYFTPFGHLPNISDFTNRRRIVLQAVKAFTSRGRWGCRSMRESLSRWFTARLEYCGFMQNLNFQSIYIPIFTTQNFWAFHSNGNFLVGRNHPFPNHV